MTEEHRAKIQHSNILNALIEHVEGTREMSATQVTAGLGLLRKALPDLSTTTIAGDEENPIRFEEIRRVLIGPDINDQDSEGIRPATH